MEGINAVAYTNLIKCNASETKDMTTMLQKINCIQRLGVVKKEIEILSPNKTVFLIGKDYDKYIPSVFNRIETKEDINVTVGAKNMPWWNFMVEVESKVIQCLRIGHPERMKKTDYIRLVSRWIQEC